MGHWKCSSASNLSILTWRVLYMLCWNPETISLRILRLILWWVMGLVLTFRNNQLNLVANFFWRIPGVQFASKWQSTWLLIAPTSNYEPVIPWALRLLPYCLYCKAPTGSHLFALRWSPERTFSSQQPSLCPSPACWPLNSCVTRFQRGFQLIA
jgi:hypothetical protein